MLKWVLIICVGLPWGIQAKRDRLPKGSYQQSCKLCSLHRDKLFCLCQVRWRWGMKNPVYKWAAIRLSRKNPHPISNNDSDLEYDK